MRFKGFYSWLLCVIASAAWLTYSHNQKALQANSSSSSNTNTYPPMDTQQEQKQTQKSQIDGYTNWKTYCDTFYHYCFKYPPDWSLQAEDTPTSYCGTRQVSILDPAKTIQVNYINTDSHDNGLFTIYPVSITNLSSANQALSIIGSYIAVSGPPNTNELAGNDVPSYRIYDSSVLSQYPIAVEHPAQFPSRGFFTDENLAINHAYNEGKITFREWLELSREWAQKMSEIGISALSAYERVATIRDLFPGVSDRELGKLSSLSAATAKKHKEALKRAQSSTTTPDQPTTA